MSTENQTPPASTPQDADFHLTRSAHGIILAFPPGRALGAASGLFAFSLLCGVMPALGLSALLPLRAGDASAVVSLALIVGFAIPFIVASVTFATLSVYMTVNMLRVEIGSDGVRSRRQVFGWITQRRQIARADIADIEPSISARHQNLFSATPRYALIARHVSGSKGDVVVAEDLHGQALTMSLRTQICAALGIR